jgi:hypothetical protein
MDVQNFPYSDNVWFLQYTTLQTDLCSIQQEKVANRYKEYNVLVILNYRQCNMRVCLPHARRTGRQKKNAMALNAFKLIGSHCTYHGVAEFTTHNETQLVNQHRGNLPTYSDVWWPYVLTPPEMSYRTRSQTFAYFTAEQLALFLRNPLHPHQNTFIRSFLRESKHFTVFRSLTVGWPFFYDSKRNVERWFPAA